MHRESSSQAVLPSQSDRPLRVLQLATMLYSGGVERWLVDLCPASRTQGIAMDIAILREVNSLFARRARERGIPIFHCAVDGGPLNFMSNLRRLLRERGPYDAIHCHVHAFSGFAVLAARLEGVPARVVHSHQVVENSSGSLARRGYIVLARALIRRFATAGLAPSIESAADLLGSSWQDDPRWRVMRCGIDLTPFRGPVPAESMRTALGIPADALVLGCVSRLSQDKNSEFLIDVLAAVLRRKPNSYLLLVGEGPLRGHLERKADEGGFRDHLILPGTRSDVPALLRGAIDVFVFPSPPPGGKEALPIAVTEAQAADLPSVISDGVTPEAVIIPDLVARVPCDAGADRWAEVVLDRASRRERGLTGRVLAVMEQSEFNCVQNVRTLADLYRNPGNR